MVIRPERLGERLSRARICGVVGNESLWSDPTTPASSSREPSYGQAFRRYSPFPSAASTATPTPRASARDEERRPDCFLRNRWDPDSSGDFIIPARTHMD